MRAKTIKRWAILIAVLSLIGGTGFFTQRYQVTRLANPSPTRPTGGKGGRFCEGRGAVSRALVGRAR